MPNHLIFGPGEAKGELKKRFEKAKAGTQIVTMETDDKNDRTADCAMSAITFAMKRQDKAFELFCNGSHESQRGNWS